MIGIWLALAGSLLMLIGAILAIARISLAVDGSTRHGAGPRAGATRRAATGRLRATGAAGGR